MAAPNAGSRAPLTPSQRDIYLDHELHPESLSYSIGGSIELPGEIDLVRWEAAAAEVFRRDPGLCSRLVVGAQGELSQEVNPRAQMVFGRVENKAGRPVDEILKEKLTTPYNWTGDELFHHWSVIGSDGSVHVALGMPHLFSDGHTIRLFFERTARSYAGADGRHADVVSYYDYLSKSPPQGPGQRVVEAWRERLEGLAPFQPAAWEDDAPGEFIDRSYAIGEDESAALEAACERFGIGPATLFRRCFALVLDQFREGEEDFLLLAIRGARAAEFAETTGCFFEVIPHRVSADSLLDSVTTAEFLKASEGGRLQALSLMELVPMLPGGVRLVFNYYDFDAVDIFGEPRQMKTWFSHRPDEVHFVVGRGARGFDLRVRSHSTVLRDHSIGERVAMVARQICAGAGAIAELDWLLPEEKVVASPADSQRAPDLLQRFDRNVASRPEAAALTDGERSYTYAQLDAEATSLAAVLLATGVAAGDRVALHLERGAMQVIAIIAVLKCGAAYVPVDPDYPAERSLLILDDAEPSCVVADASLPDRLREDLPVVDVRDLPEGTAEFERRELDPSAVAYIIYTSGSTGRPKGVEVTRHNMARLFWATEEEFQFAPNDVGVLLHSYAFDFSVWEIWSALAYGGRVVMVQGCVARDPDALLDLVKDEGITLLNQTPSAFALLAQVAAQRREELPAKLRHIVFGGEMLSPAQVEPWFEAVGDAVRLTNMYGITETTVHVSSHRMAHGETFSNIGRPISDLCIRLVNPNGRAVPTGVPGEIWVGGAGLARGYYRLPEETEARFVNVDFWDGRAYRTGDRARLRADGSLEYLGRVDHQVQVRGYRVELGEIEVAIAALEEIQQVLVVDAPEIGLVAYLETKDAVDAADLKRRLAQRLPDYMVPARFVNVTEFPLTAHGKIDRGRLPLPEGDSVEFAGEFIEPAGREEVEIANVFAGVLGLKRVGADDDFFELGGNSLSATMVALRVREALGTNLSLGAIFHHPTPRQLAAHLGGDSVEPALEIEILPDRSSMPLTFPQERVWLIESLDPDSLAYHFQALLHFYGDVDPALIADSILEIITRHEIFRTCFPSEEGRPVQRAVDAHEPEIPVIDLSSKSAEAAKDALERWCDECFSRPYSIDRLPLAEWALFTFPDGRTTLVHREHHLLHDGWSFILFVSELLERYSAKCESRAPKLRALPFQCGDFAAAHRAWMASGEGQQQLDYWKEQLRGVEGRPPLLLDKARPAQLSYAGQTLRITLEPELAQAVRGCAKREGATHFATMLAAFVAVLYRTSGESEFCVGSGVANRRFAETENLIGMLLNNLPLRIRVGSEMSFGELLGDVRETIVGALAHQDVPYDQIVHASGAVRDPRVPPLCQIFFSSYDGPIPEMEVPGAKVIMEPGIANGSAKFDLNIIVVTQPSTHGGEDEITMLWEFRTALFERETIEGMAARYFQLLAKCCQDAGKEVGKLPLGEAAPMSQGQAVPLPEPSVHRVLEAVVRDHPDAVAIVDGDVSLTYSEYNLLANRLAARLADAGVTRGASVGVCLPRGADALVAMLGILKAGAAYLPLDPTYPKGRLRVLIRTVEPIATVTAKAQEERLPGGVATILIDNLPDGLADTDRGYDGGLDEPAYTIFTSGSTGEPKGVDIPHRGILRLVFAEAAYKLGTGDRLLQLAPITFDASVFEIWGALLHGGTCVIAPEDIPSPEGLGEAIARHEITTLWLTASLFNTMIDARPQIFRPLRQLLTGGEALSVPHICRALKALPDVILINGYGPTESTTFATTYAIPRDFPETRLSVPIGYPLSNTTVRILDSHGQPVPAGVVGELMIGGDGLALGYRGAPDLDSQRFFEWRGECLYRSGDRARWLADGSIEFLGREDDQLKVRGFRIEPIEVELAVMALEGIERAVVLCDRGNLVAFFTGTASPGSLRKPLSRKLPKHLVPSQFVPVQAIPVTANGKIDRGALKAIWKSAQRRVARSDEVEAFANSRERILARIFERILERRGIGRDDSFFEAGGHSLLGLELLVKIRESFGVELPVRALFEAPTVASLTELITEGGLGDAPGRSLLPIKPGGGLPPLYFTPGGDGGEGAFLVYAGFVRDLPSGQPFYGFAARGVDVNLPPHESVETMARDYLAEIRKHRSGGTFHIAGECLGSVVAFEMARQLQAAGEAFGKLVIFDGYPPDWRRGLRHRIWSGCASVRRWMGRKPGARLVSRVLPYSEKHAPATLLPEWIRYQRTLLRYRAGYFEGELHVIRSEQQAARRPKTGWEEFADRVITHVVPGDHYTYIREHAKEAAVVLARVLAPS